MDNFIKKSVVFLGQSVQILEIRETCDLLDIKVAGIIDDDYYGNTNDFDGIPYIGSEKTVNWEDLKTQYDFFIPIIPVPNVPRNIEKRKNFIKIVDEENLPCINIIDPGCRISPRAKLGKDIYVAYNAYIAPNVYIGDHCQIHFACGVMHDCVLGRNAILNRAASMTSSVTIGENVYIAPFAKILRMNGNIGSDSCIHAGAMVFRDIAPGEIVNITSKKIYSTIADMPKD